MEDEAGFIGGATFYQHGEKVDVHARRYWAEDPAGEPSRWWGDHATFEETSLASGAAYARFSDGSEADVILRASSTQGGAFEVVGNLEDSPQVNRT